MDTGAYASYPKRRRNYKNYSFSRRRLGYKRRRVNPINQYSYKKTRVGKYFKTDQQSLKCTYNGVIYQEAGEDGTYLHTGTGTAWLNLASMLANSPEFISRYTQYSYYRLNGMKVTLSRKWIDPIALGTIGTPGWLRFNEGLPKIEMNFYPNLSSTVAGVAVAQADSSFNFSPYITTEQSHYIPFPRDFTVGTNAQGLGVWNACSSYTTIGGELAIYNLPTTTAPSAAAAMHIWDMEIELYTQFCNNTGA